MILGLNDRRSPLDGPPPRLARALRLAFGLGVSLLLVALGLEILREASRPEPRAAAPWGPGNSRFRVRWAIDVYREPWPESGLVGRLQEGTTAEVIQRLDGWLLVDTPFGPGWIDLTPKPWLSSRPVPLRPAVPVPEPEPVPLSDPMAALTGTACGNGPCAPAIPASTPVPTPVPLSESEQRARLVDLYREHSPAVAWARSRISRDGMQRLESQSFRLWTDLRDPDRMGLILGLAEQTRSRFREIFEPHFELAELEGRSEIFVFRARADYLTFYRLFGTERTSTPSGHYSMDLRTIAFSEQSVPGNSMAATLVHEMVHLLLDQTLYRGSGLPRPWIGEGLACAFAYTTGSEAGRIALVQSRRDLFGVGPAARARLDGLQRLLREGLALRLQDLFPAENDAFTGADGTRYYDAAWLLCHFLLQSDSGQHRQLLVEAIDADRTGRSLEAALRKIDSLEARWRQYTLHPARR